MATILNLENRRVSINHAEIWGKTDDGQHFYLRLRPGKSDLIIRVSDEIQDEGFISKDSALNGTGEQYEKSFNFTNYQQAKEEFQDFNGLLEETPYKFNDDNVPKL